MLAQTYLASHDYENNLVRTIKKSLTQESHASDPLVEPSHCAFIYSKLIEGINRDLGANAITRELAVRLRIAIKINPYGTEIPALIEIHNKVLQHLLVPKLGRALETIQACEAQGLPVPVIVSCEKYMPKALVLQGAFRERYFGITPLIVRGNMKAQEESYEACGDGGIITLPVSDTYEALPVKVAEIATFLNVFTTKSGFIKIDDDLTLVPFPPLNIQHVRDTLNGADYMGVALKTSFQDRTWHVGKCADAVPTIYGRPYRTAWPRGVFYAMSHRALNTLATYYMRFPGCLDGELYEDKGMSEILYANNIIVTPYVLEKLFGFDSDKPERFTGV